MGGKQCGDSSENLEPPFDPVISLLYIYTKNLKLAYHSNATTSTFMAAQFTIAKLQNQTRGPSTDRWIKKMCYTYTFNIIQL